MENIGTVLELTEKEAIILTSSKGFMSIKRRPGMFLGQKVQFKKSDIINPRSKIAMFSTIASGIAAVLVITFFYIQSFYTNQDIYAYVDVDINPSLELMIDQENEIVKVKAINEDANTLLEDLELKGMQVKTALTEVVKESREKGFIEKDKETVVLISAALNEDSQKDKNLYGNEDKLDKLLNTIDSRMDELEQENITSKIIKVDTEDMVKARENDMSMGKYAVYKEAREKGIDIALSEVKEGNITELVKKTGISLGDESDPALNVAVSPSPTPIPKPTTSVVLPTPTLEPTPTPKPVATITPAPEYTPTPTRMPKGMVAAGDRSILYSGSWSTIEGQSKTSGATGSYVEFTFTGSSLKWFGAIGNKQGKADVYIDGELDASVDCYTSDKPMRNILIYQKSGLTKGSHTIRIVVKGDKHPLSKETFIEVNAFQYK